MDIEEAPRQRRFEADTFVISFLFPGRIVVALAFMDLSLLHLFSVLFGARRKPTEWNDLKRAC